MVTRYADLLDRADTNLAVASARRAHPTGEHGDQRIRRLLHGRGPYRRPRWARR